MHYRQFGSTGLTVSEVGFGCARIGAVFGGNSRKDTLRVLDRALAEGITFYDTADMYTQGESERLLGEAFSRARDKVVIASKFGYLLPAQKKFVSRVKPLVKPLVARLGLRARHVHAGLRGAVAEQDFSETYLTGAVEASLRRLKTDYIDVYQLHAPPVEVLERGEFVEPLERLRQQGKIRSWGVACESYTDVGLCFRYPEIKAIQVGLNVVDQEALDGAIPGAAERGMGVIARQVFASGLLTKPVERIGSDVQLDARKRDQLAAYGRLVEESGRGRSELALKFALARPDVSVILLGMSRMDQLEANLHALSAPELTLYEQQLLRAQFVAT